MWWECSECGGHLHRPSAPVVCPECGIAGPSFMPADPDDLWLRAGIEHPELVAQA